MRHSCLAVLAALVLSACASAPSSPPAAAAPAAEPATAPAAAPAAAPAEQAAVADEAAAPQVVASAETDDSKKLICREEPGTGTHVRRAHRICATEAEWARIREQNQKALQNMSTRRAQSAPQGH